MLYALAPPRPRFSVSFALMFFTVLALVVAWSTVAIFMPGLVFADGSPPPDATRLVLPQTQLIAAIVGSLVPSVTYFLNKHAPWTNDKVKAIVLVVVAAAGGALTTLLDAGGIPVTWETAQIVGTAVVLAFLAHVGFWRPSGWSAKLGAGTNRQDRASPA
jgi:hypothetical protein